MICVYLFIIYTVILLYLSFEDLFPPFATPEDHHARVELTYRFRALHLSTGALAQDMSSAKILPDSSNEWTKIRFKWIKMDQNGLKSLAIEIQKSQKWIKLNQVDLNPSQPKAQVVGLIEELLEAAKLEEQRVCVEPNHPPALRKSLQKRRVSEEVHAKQCFPFSFWPFSFLLIYNIQ